MEMPKVMHVAVDLMQTWINDEIGKGFKLQIIEDLRRTEPCKVYPNGRLGANVKLTFGEEDPEPVVMFLSCESMAEEMVCNPMGQFIVKEVAWEMLKPKISKMINDQGL